MVEVVISINCVGLFLTREATKKLNDLGSKYVEQVFPERRDPYFRLTNRRDPDKAIPRHDPLLVKVVKELGERSWIRSSSLEIVRLRGNKYYIETHDGEYSDDYGYEAVSQPDDIKWIEV